MTVRERIQQVGFVMVIAADGVRNFQRRCEIIFARFQLAETGGDAAGEIKFRMSRRSESSESLMS